MILGYEAIAAFYEGVCRNCRYFTRRNLAGSLHPYTCSVASHYVPSGYEQGNLQILVDHKQNICRISALRFSTSTSGGAEVAYFADIFRPLTHARRACAIRGTGKSLQLLQYLQNTRLCRVLDSADVSADIAFLPAQYLRSGGESR